MVSGVRSSCDSFPPKVRRYCVCSLRRASRRSKPRDSAPISSALAGFGHVETDLAVAAHGGVGGVAQASDAQADPGRKAEHDEDRRGRGQEGEIEQTRHRTIAQAKQLIRRLLENHGAARLPVDRRWARRRSAATPDSRRCAPIPHAAARRAPRLTLLPPSRSGADDCSGKLEVSTAMKCRYQDCASSSVSLGSARVQVARGPQLERVGVDHGDAGAVANEGAQQLIQARHREE